MIMTEIGYPTESSPDEKRIALVPKNCSQLVKCGLGIIVEQSYGEPLGISDQEYISAGAKVAPTRAEVFSSSNVIVHVRAIGANLANGDLDLPLLRPNQIVVGLCNPLGSNHAAAAYAAMGVTSFALELIPRTPRAQSMDVLSSQATLVGYLGLIIAANAAPRIFPMLVTSSGTIKPAKILVLGAGIAGLQAISTARRLGAVVQGYDIRPAAIEQIKSLGAKAIEAPFSDAPVQDPNGYANHVGPEFQLRQRELLHQTVSQSDIVICTAGVPGRRSPVLVSEDMVHVMRSGSVIVDLTAEFGGNCELTIPGEEINERGVKILGPLNIPSRLPIHASEMFSQNVTSFLTHLLSTKEISLGDEIIGGTLLTRQFQVIHSRVKEEFGFGDYCVLTSFLNHERTRYES